MLQKAQPIPVSVPMLAIFLKIHLKKTLNNPYMFFLGRQSNCLCITDFHDFFQKYLIFCSSDLMSSPPQRAPPGI